MPEPNPPDYRALPNITSLKSAIWPSQFLFMNYSARGQDCRLAFRQIATPPGHFVLGEERRGAEMLKRIIDAKRGLTAAQVRSNSCGLTNHPRLTSSQIMDKNLPRTASPKGIFDMRIKQRPSKRNSQERGRAPLIVSSVAVLVTAGLFTTVPQISFGQATAQAPDEVLIGPVTVPASYAGIDLSTPVRAYINLSTATDGMKLRVRVFGDLSQLQGKISQIIDAFPLPKDNCASYSPTNQVVKIWGKQLTSSAAAAVITLHGNVEVWACVQNPIPNSKIEWRNDGPLHLSIPHVVTWPGSPIKTIVATQPFDATLPLALQLVDEHTVALKPGQPNITLGGQYVGITNAILRIAGIDVNAKAAEALGHAVDPDKLEEALPPEILKLNPKITKATFLGDAGVLQVELDLSAMVPPDQLTGVFEAILKSRKPAP